MLVLFVAIVGATAVNASLVSMTRVRHVRSVLSALTTVSTLVTDAESGQRGFLLTHETSYLQAYDRATLHIEAALDDVRTSVASSEMTSCTTTDVNLLVELVHAKMDE